MADSKENKNSSGGLSLASVTSNKVEAAKTKGPNNEEQKDMFTKTKSRSSEDVTNLTQEIRFSVFDELGDGPLVSQSHKEETSSNVHGLEGISTEIRSQVEIMEALKLIALFSGEAKVLESEMNKIIKKIYATNPQLKPYLMKMKKLLKEHSNIESILDKLPNDNKKAS